MREKCANVCALGFGCACVCVCAWEREREFETFMQKLEKKVVWKYFCIHSHSLKHTQTYYVSYYEENSVVNTALGLYSQHFIFLVTYAQTQ